VGTQAERHRPAKIRDVDACRRQNVVVAATDQAASPVERDDEACDLTHEKTDEGAFQSDGRGQHSDADEPRQGLDDEDQGGDRVLNRRQRDLSRIRGRERERHRREHR
jgi:hypothetical protein